MSAYGTSDLDPNPHLIKIRDWVDGEDDGTWPAPPEYSEYRVEGQMRLDVLRRLGREPNDPCTVRLIHGVIEGGWSEWTIEHDYPLEVWVDDAEQSQRVFEHTSFWSSDSLPAFLNWLGGAA